MAVIATTMTAFAQKKLVLYYSETGTTKTVAQELQKQTGADIESIEAVKPLMQEQFGNTFFYDYYFNNYQQPK